MVTDSLFPRLRYQKFPLTFRQILLTYLSGNDAFGPRRPKAAFFIYGSSRQSQEKTPPTHNSQQHGVVGQFLKLAHYPTRRVPQVRFLNLGLGSAVGPTQTAKPAHSQPSIRLRPIRKNAILQALYLQYLAHSEIRKPFCLTLLQKNVYWTAAVYNERREPRAGSCVGARFSACLPPTSTPATKNPRRGTFHPSHTHSRNPNRINKILNNSLYTRGVLQRRDYDEDHWQLLQLRVLRLGLRQNRNIRIGIFP